jgi:hypothetical protein
MRAPRVAQAIILALMALALAGPAKSRNWSCHEPEDIECCCSDEQQRVPEWARRNPNGEDWCGWPTARIVLIALITGILGFALGRATR